MTTKPRKWNIPLTYKPKIEAVVAGTCMQTIRSCTVSKSKKHPGLIIRKNEGDLIRFYRWTGRPYWSKPEPITKYMTIREVINVKIYPDGFSGLIEWRDNGEWILTPWEHLEYLADKDGIIPPTGEALRDVLISKNGKIPKEGIEAQIIRWLP